MTTARGARAVGGTASTCLFRFEALGTRWEIETQEPLGHQLQQRILERIRRFDATYSRFRPDSLVSRVAAAPDGGCFDFPNDSIALFDLYDRLHAVTGGSVDPLVGRDLELLGYDQTYSLTPAPDLVRAEAHAPGRPVWSKGVIRNGTSLVTRRPLVVDVGAAGKGYLVDIVAEILREAGFASGRPDPLGVAVRSRARGELDLGRKEPLGPGLARVAGVQSFLGPGREARLR